MSERRLVLRKEALAELQTDELAQVVGGGATTPLTGCLRDLLSDLPVCQSFLETCVSNTSCCK